jgi:hypothetical protein
MPKFCNNGHQMEDSWETCPYCQRTGFQNAAGASGNLAKTRLEFDGAQPPPPPAGGVPAQQFGAPAARKTVLLGGRPKGSLTGWVVVMEGEQKGEDFRIREGQNSIGSAPDADVVIRDQAVSGKHAMLRCRDKKFLLTDLDSANGTLINDGLEPIAVEELHDNDLIKIGSTTLKVKLL